jgi:hypothetical protein
MKKVAILVLLIALVASFSFAQVSLKSTLELSNINNADIPGKQAGVDPNLTFTFDGAASTDIGPGKLTLSGEISYQAHFTDKYWSKAAIDDAITNNSGILPDGSDATKATAGTGNNLTGDNFISLGYLVPVGPGSIDVGVKQSIDTWVGGVYNWYLEPWIGYTHIGLGPATLGVTVLYDYAFNGSDTDGRSTAYIHPTGWQASADRLIFKLDADFAFGLGFTYKFIYAVGPLAAYAADADLGVGTTDTGIFQIAYLDLWYKLSSALTLGVEIDGTGPAFKGPKDAAGDGPGFQLKPYANVGINDNLSAGFYLKVGQLLNDYDADILFSPGVWIKYTL